MNVPARGTQEYIDYVIRLSERGVLRQGVVNEPRVYFDEIVINPDGQETAGSPGVFVNGEQFPVRLTHLLAAPRFLNTATPPTPDNPLNIQRCGLRLIFHDQFYMNSVHLPLSVWANKAVAPPPSVAPAISTWDFVENGQPFVLSARDTLQVQVSLRDAADPAGLVPIAVAFTGFGMLSKRPYDLNGQVNLTTLAPTFLSTVDFRNDGSEPIVVTDMTVNVGATQAAPFAIVGNIARLALQVKQFGNGTNANWFIGPQVPTPLPRMQASLLGVTAGTAVVHQFPGDGLLWEPGEGITVSTQRLPPPPAAVDNFNSVLCLGLAGYIMVT